ncbi:MAG: T9SS type A sorting domain-containing protein [Bacteroidales bacterium]|nr:T9SS type A sorting domain-containing protein [Bacteroidales bacterium]
MIKKIILISTIAILFATTSFAQLRIDSLGRTLVGTPYMPHDPYGVTTMSIFGNHGTYKAGSKLTFGDFGQQDHNGWNVFVGEYGNFDSDQLWLHGKNGIVLSTGNGSVVSSLEVRNNVLFPGATETTQLAGMDFRIPITASVFSVFYGNGTMSGSTDMNDALTQIMQLSPVTYTYTVPANRFGDDLTPVADISDIPSEQITDKTADDLLKDSELQSQLIGDRFSYGLDLGGFEEQFPTLVSTDGEGNKYIDYVSLVPVLVASIQEQQQIIESQNAIIEDIRTQMYKMQDTLHQLVLRRDSLATATNSHLDQNIPNPFDEGTNIGYYISTDATMATLYIFNMSGILIDALNITQFGTGSIDFDGSLLPEGMYVYTLVVDGNIADSKRMMIVH